MPITDWVKAKDCTITLNSGPQRAISARYNRSAGRVDRTNLRSSGEFEGTTDIVTSEMEITVAVSAAEGPPSLVIGTAYPCTYVTTGGRSHSGTFVFEGESESNGPRGGYDLVIRGFFTGTTTNS